MSGTSPFSVFWATCCRRFRVRKLRHFQYYAAASIELRTGRESVGGSNEASTGRYHRHDSGFRRICWNGNALSCLYGRFRRSFPFHLCPGLLHSGRRNALSECDGRTRPEQNRAASSSDLRRRQPSGLKCVLRRVRARLDHGRARCVLDSTPMCRPSTVSLCRRASWPRMSSWAAAPCAGGSMDYDALA